MFVKSLNFAPNQFANFQKKLSVNMEICTKYILCKLQMNRTNSMQTVCNVYTNCHSWITLEYRIIVPPRLLIFEKFSNPPLLFQPPFYEFLEK